MRRAFRRFLGRALPERVKGRFRSRLFGGSQPAHPFEVSATSAGGVVTAHIADYFTVRLPAEAWQDVQYHLTSNADTVEETRLLLEEARRCGVLFDVGAHRCLLSTLFCLANPGARAIAFEPSPALLVDAEQMRQLNGLDTRLVVRAVAVGASTGTLSGLVGPEGMLQPLTAAADLHAEPFLQTTLDAEVLSSGVVPDLVKIDVEGYELEVIRGARNLLATRKPVVMLELHLDLLERSGIQPAAVVQELQQYGYEFFALSGARLRAHDVFDSVKAVLRCVAR